MSDQPYLTNRRGFLRAGTGAAAAATLPARAFAYQPTGADAETDVRIRRDEYGVPHVYATGAGERPAVFFGHGYAVAEDRLFQLEMYRRFYYGTVAEVLGPGEDDEWIAFDREARRNRSSDTPLPVQFDEQLETEHLAVLDAFADGINRYIERMREREAVSDEESSEALRQQFHKGFHDYGFRPEPWDREDVAGVFVASMAYFSNYQLETLNASVLSGLQREYDDETAMAVLSDLNWGDDPSAPTSTRQPEVGYTPPYVPAGGDEGETDPADRSGIGDAGASESAGDLGSRGHYRIPSSPSAVHEAEMERQRTLATGLDELGLPFKLGSNALAVDGDHTESGDALLFGGPQMGFTTPSVMYEVGLHGSDFDVTGSTVAGYPFVMFGHNRNGAFTSTAGIDNSIQMFVEEIRTDGETDQYRFRDEWYDVESHTETIPVADAPDESMTIRRTRHGVVTQWRPDDGEAIAQSRSYEGLDAQSWRAYYEAQFATDAEEFVAASQSCTYSLNFLWAGADGDIAYVHLGRYPDWEEVPWDTRFPADGTQYELTPDDYLAASDGEVPSAVNPEPGFSAQWNNKPAPDWNNGDMSYAWGTDHRVQRIINLVRDELETEGAVGYESLKEFVYDIAFVDLRAIRYGDALLAAYESAAGDDASELERDALDAVREWNNFRQGSGDRYMGQYPVGYTVFDRFFPKLLEKTFRPTFGSSLYQQALVYLDYRYGRPTLMRALHPEQAALEPALDYFGGDPEAVFVAAFRETVAELREEYGDDVSTWRADARVDDLDNMALFGMPIGVGDAGDMPFLNRGTENHFVRVGGSNAGTPAADYEAENVLPPGESGYVAPDGTTAEHYSDQLDEFVEFAYKPLRFTRSEVARGTETTETVTRDGE